MSHAELEPIEIGGRRVEGRAFHGWLVLWEATPTYHRAHKTDAKPTVKTRRFVCQCAGCGLLRLHYASNLFYKQTGNRRAGFGCSGCGAKQSGLKQRREAERRLRGQPCRDCGRKNLRPGRANNGRCVACQRRLIRNGACPKCGCALFRSKPCKCEAEGL